LDAKTEFFRHTVATLAYRASKVLRDAPPEFANFETGPSPRTPVQILAHMGDLFDWSLALAEGRHVWHVSEPLPWTQEIHRFFAALGKFDACLASCASLGSTAERLFQGPLADALTHTGQLAMLRRMAGCPMRGENYFVADVAAGNAGIDQPPPRVEFA
jgi:hypothetical protein